MLSTRTAVSALKYKERLRMRVVSARPLNLKEKEMIRKSFIDRYKKDIYIGKTQVDESLLGGVKVYIKDTLYDGSLIGRLKALGRDLLAKELG